jgi:hypothetical protein
MVPLGSEALDAFRRDGFITINRLIGPSEISLLSTILLNLHEENIGFKEGAQFDAALADADVKQRRFPQILNPHVFAKELMGTEFHKLGAAIAKQILGKNARFRSDISFLKPAKIGSDTPWHQDEAFDNPAFDHEQITIWLAVTPADATNSCMSFIPGSHQLPVLEHRPLGNNPRVHALECVGSFDPSLAIECPLLAGDATIHAHRTLHYAGPNHAGTFRLAYALLFDTPPTLRLSPVVYSWRSKQEQTDRAARERRWRRRGGIILHVWRQRRRIGFDRLIAELRRLAKICCQRALPR